MEFVIVFNILLSFGESNSIRKFFFSHLCNGSPKKQNIRPSHGTGYGVGKLWRKKQNLTDFRNYIAI